MKEDALKQLSERFGHNVTKEENLIIFQVSNWPEAKRLIDGINSIFKSKGRKLSASLAGGYGNLAVAIPVNSIDYLYNTGNVRVIEPSEEEKPEEVKISQKKIMASLHRIFPENKITPPSAYGREIMNIGGEVYKIDIPVSYHDAKLVTEGIKKILLEDGVKKAPRQPGNWFNPHATVKHGSESRIIFAPDENPKITKKILEIVESHKQDIQLFIEGLAKEAGKDARQRR